MFDIGFLELLIIGIVALIVVGPKDLPGMFRTLGKFTAKARSMAREFSRAMEAAADDTGMGEISKDLKTLTSTRNLGLDSVKDVAKDMAKWTPDGFEPKKEVGPETAKLREERAEQNRKVREAMEAKGQEKLDAEVDAEADAWEEEAEDPGMVQAPPEAPKPKDSEPEAKKPTAKKKPAAKKSAAKKPAAKKPPAKKPAAKKTTAKKPATKGAADT